MEIIRVIEALGALAQESRLAIYRLLVQAGPEGMPAGQIAERLRIPQATMSFHLMHLSHAGLVHSRRAGRFVIYSADFDAMHALIAYLTENCCGGEPERCAPAPLCLHGAEPHDSLISSSGHQDGPEGERARERADGKRE